jgi:hypothetical protein
MWEVMSRDFISWISNVYLLDAIDGYIAKKEDENMKNISSSFLFKVVPMVELQSTSR